MPNKNNIVINLNLITKRQMLEYRRGRKSIVNSDDSEDSLDPLDLERYDFENLFQLVIEAWPHGEITFENFLELPLPESARIDNAIADALTGLSKKK
jgi:hypothetical protein